MDETIHQSSDFLDSLLALVAVAVVDRREYWRQLAGTWRVVPADVAVASYLVNFTNTSCT